MTLNPSFPRENSLDWSMMLTAMMVIVSLSKRYWEWAAVETAREKQQER